MSQEHNSELDVLLKKLVKESPQDLGTFVKEACQEDPSLWTRLKLTHAEKQRTASGDSMENDWSSLEAQLESGDSVGPYVIGNLLGEGGMGQVFKAEQQEPIQRTVALKIIKAGMSSRQVLKRFQMEQQTLATMSHPYIAQVYDAGVTPDRRPYFVMEMIEGQPLNVFCDTRKLDIKARLELFGKVCDAVRYAHQRGIVHRDLKPANILVSEKEDKFVPKVIDFGIAKALDAGQEEGETRLTAVGTTMGSPGYMSPEQAQTNENEIDTRSDVYALGVILYELTTGFLPISPDQWRLKSLSEMLAIILHKSAPKPSELLKASREQLSEILPNRQTTFNKLHRELKGDLDWIILKAVEKEKNRRYSTAAEFQTDIEAYLKGMPVSAGPPGVGYQIKKLVQRHKLPVAAAIIVLVTLLVGIVGTTSGFVQARKEAEKSQRSLKMLEEFILAPKPLQKGSDLKVTELVDDFADKLKNDSNLDPDVQAYLNRIIGSTYLALGTYRESELFLEKSVSLCHKENLINTTTYDAALNDLSFIKSELGKYKEAIDIYQDLLRLRQTKLPEKSEELLGIQNALAYLYSASNSTSKADDLFDYLLSEDVNLEKISRKVYYNTLFNYAVHTSKKYKFTAALKIQEKVYKYYFDTYGEININTYKILTSMSNTYYSLNDFNSAAELESRALNISNTLFGTAHPKTINLTENFAITNISLGNMNYALELLELAWKGKIEIYGKSNKETLEALKNFMRCNLENNNPQKALDLFETFSTDFSHSDSPNLSIGIDAHRIKGLALIELGEKEKAKLLLSELLLDSREKIGYDHRLTLEVQQNLAHLYLDLNLKNDFRSLILDFHQRYRSRYGPSHDLTLGSLRRTLNYCIQTNNNDDFNFILKTIHSVYISTYKNDTEALSSFSKHLEKHFPNYFAAMTSNQTNTD